MACDWLALVHELRSLSGQADAVGVALEEAGEEVAGHEGTPQQWPELREKLGKLAELAEDVSVRAADLVNMIDPDTGD